MTTPKSSVQSSPVLQPVPTGTRVIVINRGKGVVTNSAVKGQYLNYDVKLDGTNVQTGMISAKMVLLDTPVIQQMTPPSLEDVAEGEKLAPRDVNHYIVTDEAVPEPTEQVIRKTPAGLRKIREDRWGKIFGDDRPVVKCTESQESALDGKNGMLRLTDFKVTDKGLTIDVFLHINVRHAAQPHDLIELQLTIPFQNESRIDDRPADTIAVLTPDVKTKSVTIEAVYTWPQLAKALNRSGLSSMTSFVQAFPQIGVQAVWYEKLGEKNSPNHWSGGVKQKDGSGAIELRPPSDDDLIRSEKLFQDDWNLYDVMRETHPLWHDFSQMLEPGKRIGTTLEAESEYLVNQDQFKSVLAKLETLMDDADQRGQLGIKVMKSEGVSTCTDTYYDVPGYLLLADRIVLRRRSVRTDPVGTFLLAVKGRKVASKKNSSEYIRIAAQLQLKEKEASASGALAKFLGDKSMRNAFGRVLDDAAPEAAKEAWGKIDKALEVTSERTKYSFELADSTTIAFSADQASAVFSGKTAELFSIEFGVGHPGLNYEGLQTSGSGPSDTGSTGADSSQTQPLIARHYHVPHDLTNENLFTKSDYRQFQLLRDKVMRYLFGGAESKLQPGGNKAHDLAVSLGMIGKD